MVGLEERKTWTVLKRSSLDCRTSTFEISEYLHGLVRFGLKEESHRHLDVSQTWVLQINGFPVQGDQMRPKLRKWDQKNIWIFGFRSSLFSTSQIWVLEITLLSKGVKRGHKIQKNINWDQIREIEEEVWFCISFVSVSGKKQIFLRVHPEFLQMPWYICIKILMLVTVQFTITITTVLGMALARDVCNKICPLLLNPGKAAALSDYSSFRLSSS